VEKGPDPSRVKSGQHIVFLAIRLSEIPIEVLLPNGVKAQEATVKVRSAKGEDEILCKRSEPVIELEPGPVTLSAKTGLQG